MPFALSIFLHLFIALLYTAVQSGSSSPSFSYLVKGAEETVVGFHVIVLCNEVWVFLLYRGQEMMQDTIVLVEESDGSIGIAKGRAPSAALCLPDSDQLFQPPSEGNA
jgi:hypothetical protein